MKRTLLALFSMLLCATAAMAHSYIVHEHEEPMPKFSSLERAAFEVTSDNPQQAIRIMRTAARLQAAGIKTTVLFKRKAVGLLDIRKDDPRRANPNSWQDAPQSRGKTQQPPHTPYPAPKISALPPQATANLIQHIEYHASLGGAVFVCPTCMKEFDMTPEHLPDHVIYKPELASQMLPNAAHLY